MGIVYLLHFEKPYKTEKRTIQHYIGFCERDLPQRMERHYKGQGSKLLRAVIKSGICVYPSRIWENVERNFERKLKNRKNAKKLCPTCNLKGAHNNAKT